MRHHTDQDISPKVVLLGNSGVGKTSILMAYAHPEQNLPINQATIGCHCQEITMNVENHPVNLKIWDTAGQETYSSIVPIYIRDSNVAILVYDQMDLQSFQSLEHWRSILMEENGEKVPIIVVSNKADLSPNHPSVNEEMAKNFAKSIDAPFQKVSAVSHLGIDELFTEVAKIASRAEATSKFYSTAKPTVQTQEQCC